MLAMANILSLEFSIGHQMKIVVSPYKGNIGAWSQWECLLRLILISRLNLTFVCLQFDEPSSRGFSHSEIILSPPSYHWKTSIQNKFYARIHASALLFRAPIVSDLTYRRWPQWPMIVPSNSPTHIWHQRYRRQAALARITLQTHPDRVVRSLPLRHRAEKPVPRRSRNWSSYLKRNRTITGFQRTPPAETMDHRKPNRMPCDRRRHSHNISTQSTTIWLDSEIWAISVRNFCFCRPLRMLVSKFIQIFSIYLQAQTIFRIDQRWI